MKRFALIIALAAFPLLSGCGFTPLYATAESGGKTTSLSSVHLDGVSGSEKATPALTRAFTQRTAQSGADNVEFDISVDVRESAEPLAVQLDSSVTRYNYKLAGKYTLTRRADGKVITGVAKSVASFNIVDSQYSTLFAEDAAREKAARSLVEAIERDYLLKLAALREGEDQPKDWDDRPLQPEPRTPLEERAQIP